MAPRQAYDLWAAHYPPTAHNPLMRVEQATVAPLLGSIRASRVLDVGTGSGRYLEVLRSAGASTIVGLDFSPTMLRRVDRRAMRICADGRRLPFVPRSFELVNASLVAGDIEDLGEWIAQIASVLTSGGHFVYSDFHPAWAANKWRRTFETAEGRAIEIPYTAHTVHDHLAAVRGARLQLLAIREPRLTADGDPGIETFRRRWGNPPVVIVVHARKAAP